MSKAIATEEVAIRPITCFSSYFGVIDLGREAPVAIHL